MKRRNFIVSLLSLPIVGTVAAKLKNEESELYKFGEDSVESYSDFSDLGWTDLEGGKWEEFFHDGDEISFSGSSKRFKVVSGGGTSQVTITPVIDA